MSSEPPTPRSVPAIGADSFSPTASSAPQRRSFSCYHCNNSFHIIPTATTSPSAPSSFRCPRCQNRHLIPNYAVSPPPLQVTPTSAPPSRDSNYGAPAPSRFDYESFDEESDSDDDDEDEEDYDDEEEEDYDSDDSLPTLTTRPDLYLNTPASKSIVDSLPVKIFSPNPSAPQQSCAICMENFVVDSRVNELPCKHYFHRDCVVEWLQRNNSCPLCRFKLPVNVNDGGETNNTNSDGDTLMTESENVVVM